MAVYDECPNCGGRKRSKNAQCAACRETVGWVHTGVCKVCEQEFEQHRLGHGRPRERCDRCETLAAAPRIGQIVTSPCKNCGDPFEQVRGASKPFTLCERCRVQAAEDERRRRLLRGRESNRLRREAMFAAGVLVRRVCDDCGDEFTIRPTLDRLLCRTCTGRRSRARRRERIKRLREERREEQQKLSPIVLGHGMKSLVAQAPVAQAWLEYLRDQIPAWDPSFQTALEMYAMTMAQIESGYRWLERQRENGATVRDLMTAEQLLDTRMRIAIKLAHELGLTPRSAISMAKDAGSLREIKANAAFERIHQHVLTTGNGSA